MKLKRYFTISISGEIAVSELTAKVLEQSPSAETEDIKLNSSIMGTVVNNLSSGVIFSDEVASEINFVVNASIFHAGILLFEFCFEADAIPESFSYNDFFMKKTQFSVNGERYEDPLVQYNYGFFFRAMRFSEIAAKMSGISIINPDSQIEIHKNIREIVMLSADFMGDEVYLNTELTVAEHSLFLLPEKELSNKLSSEGEMFIADRIVQNGNSIYCNGSEEEFLQFYKLQLYMRAFFKFKNSILMKWLEQSRGEAKHIRMNLNEQNKVYWNKLKNRLEVWDLNFLDFYAATVTALHQIDENPLSNLMLNDSYLEKNRKEFETGRIKLLKNMEHVKYSLENMSTPGKAHDEQILQRETEKGNERIMLLSFLAMSIPLLGAILAPGITVLTKITAALVLCLMPVIYFIIRKYHHTRDNKKSSKMYLLNLKESQLLDIEKTQGILQTIENNPNRSRKSKDETITLLKAGLSTASKHIDDIEKELAKL